MPHRPLPLTLLRTFEVAARHLSFKQAAAELHITPAAVSQQIKALEDWLGTPLFLRLTRALRLSDAGTALLPGVQQGLASLGAAVRGVQASPEPRALRLTAPPSLATYWLVARLPQFYALHPDIDVRLSSSSSAVTTTASAEGELAPLRAPDGAAGGRDASTLAILFGTGPYPGWQVDALMTPLYQPVCAPGLLAQAQRRYTSPAPLADLLQLPLIHDDTLAPAPGGAAPGLPAWGWPQWLAAAGVAAPAVLPGRHFSNAVLAIEAALAGQGVALAAQPLVAAHLAAGSLVVASHLALPSPCHYHLVGHPGQAQRPAVVAFRQWLVDQAAAPLPPPAAPSGRPQGPNPPGGHR